MGIQLVTVFALIVLFSAVLNLSWKLRYFSFLVFIFLSIARLPISVGFFSEQTIRLPLAMILIFSGHKDVISAVYKPINPTSLLLILLWSVLLSIAWAISNMRISQDLYIIFGNFMFFILVVSYVQHMTSREFITLIILIVIARIPGVLINIPDIRAVLEKVGFYWGTVYHQSSGQASIFILPFLLLSISVANKLWKKGLLWGLVAITFYLVIDSGARSPALVFGLVMIFWWRKIKYALLVGLLILMSFQFYMTNMKSDSTAERYDRLFSAVSTGDINEAQNIEFRYEHLRFGMAAIVKEPLFGHGYRSWLKIMSEEVGILGYTMAPHNEPLRILVEYGIVGFSIFMTFLWSCIKDLKRKPGKDFWSTVSYTFLLAILVVYTVNIFHNALFSRAFFLLVAIASVLPTMIKRYNRELTTKNDADINTTAEGSIELKCT